MLLGAGRQRIGFGRGGTSQGVTTNLAQSAFSNGQRTEGQKAKRVNKGNVEGWKGWKCDLGLGGIRNAFDRFLMMFLVSDSESLWGFAESLCERCFLFFCARGIYFENRQTDMEVYEDSKQQVPETNNCTRQQEVLIIQIH